MNDLNKLGTLSKKIGSGSTPRGGYKSYVPNGIPLIRSQNVLMRAFTRSGLVYISDDTHTKMKATEVVPGDVLLNITGASIGRACVVPDEICPANVNQHVCIIRCDDRIIADWIVLLITSDGFQKYIMETQAGGTRQALTKSDIEQFEIPKLSPTEQSRLVSEVKGKLSLIERAALASAMKRDEIANLANSIIFETCNSRCVVNMSLEKALVEVTTGIGKSWREHSVLGATRAGLASAKEPPGKHAERYKPVTAGTVFYNPMRILIGSIAFVDDDDEPGITSPDYVVLKGKPGVVDSRWFYYWLRSPLGKRCIQSLARGAVRERMLFNRLAEGEIDLPDYDTQLKASQALAQLKPMRAAIQKQISELELLPHKLLKQVFES